LILTDHLAENDGADGMTFPDEKHHFARNPVRDIGVQVDLLPTPKEQSS
jgi:hypothetical protein